MAIAKDETLKTLTPVSRVQSRMEGVVLRAMHSQNFQTYRGNSTIMAWDMAAFASWTLALIGDSTSIAIDGSNDLNPNPNSWGAIDYWSIGRNVAPIGQGGSFGTGFNIESAGTQFIGGNRQTRFIRVRAITTSSQRLVGLSAFLSQQPLTPPRTPPLFAPEDLWTYTAPTGGIVSTAGVTLKSAPNNQHRLFATRVDLKNGGNAGTEVTISDSGTVLWRDYLGAGDRITRDLNPAVRAAAGSALTLTCASASASVPIYANVAGLTGLA